MASFYNNKISTTYVSIIKSLDNAALTASLKELSDGSGNATGLFMNTGGDFKVTNILEWGTLKDTGENISITKFVDEADGIANNDNDTTIPTTAAIVDYVAARITLEDLDFRGDDSTVLGSVDLDSQTFAIVGTSNEIETSTSAGSQQLQIGLPNNVTISGNLQVNGLLKGNNNLVVKDTSDRTMAAFYGGNKVELYFNDSKKFETTSDGVTITGGLTATGSSVFTSATFSGTITGNVTGDLTGNVTATSVLANGVEATTRGVADNSNAVATTAFVQSVVTAQDLDFSGDGGTGSIDLDSQTFAIIGTTNEIETSASSQTLTIGLPSSIAVNVVGNLTGDVSGNVTGNLTGDVTGDLTGNVTSSSVLANGVTGTTQPQSDNSTRIATTAYVDIQAGLSDTLSEVLAIGNTTGATKISVDNTSGGIDFIDDAKARFGTGNDLEIYHDGSNSYISEGGTGNLYIQGSDSIYLQSTTGETLFRGISNNAAILFYDGNSKISTTTGGVLVEGIAVADGLDMGDNEKIRLGDSQDLEIYHDGSNSYIQDVGTGNLIIEGSADLILKATGSNNLIVCNANAEVQLMHNGTEKLKTTTTGITVTGNVNSTGSIDANAEIRTVNNNYFESTTTGSASIRLLGINNSNDIYMGSIDSGASNVYIRSAGTNAISIDGSQDVSLAGSLTIAQNLTVNGTTTTINTSTIAVEDSMIEMAKDNAANSLDIGTYGKYNDGSARYLGLFSDASDSNKFKLFKNLTVQPTTTVDTSDASFALADLDVAGLTASGSTAAGVLTLKSTAASDLTITTTAANTWEFSNSGNNSVYNGYSHTFKNGSTTGLTINNLGNSTFAGNVLLNGYLSVEGTSGNTGGATDRWIGGDGTAGTWFYNVPTGSSHLFGINNSNILTLNGTGATFAGNINLADSKYVYWGGANDFYIGHDATNTGMVNSTGHLYISNYAADKDTVFQNDNGSGGVAEYFRLDGGTETVEFAKNATFAGDLTVNGANITLNNSSGSFGAEAVIRGSTSTGTPKAEVAFKRASSGDGATLVLRSSNSSGTIADAVTIDTSQNSTFAGDVSLTSGALSITSDGSNAVTFTESSNGLLTIAAPDDIILECGSDIVLDANGADIRFKDNGTEFGRISKGGGSDLIIQSSIADKDIFFAGTDGTTGITALLLDMSNAGSATFNDDIDFGGKLTQTGTGANTFGGTGTFTDAVIATGSYPGLSLTNPSNTRFSLTNRHTDNRLSFDVTPQGGSTVEVMDLTSTGLGIGRRTASYKLTLISSSTVQNGVYISAGTGNGNHSLYVENQDSSAEFFAVRGDGEIRLNATSGHTYAHTGIRFGTNASANNLDDYEEGTWTPTIKDLGGNLATLSTANGTYTKIGRLVVLNYNVQLSSKGSMTGNYVHLGGLPFNHPTTDNGTGTIDKFNNMASNMSSLTWDTTSTASVCWLMGVVGTEATSSSYITVAQISDTTKLKGTIIYHT